MLQGKGLLTPIQKEFISVFAQFSDQAQFYLTGGTALTEYFLGHRLSYDLDFFTNIEGLILPVSYQIEKYCPAQRIQVSVTRRFASYVELLLTRGEEKIRVDLALDSPFRLEPPILSDMGVWVNNLQDLKIDKLLAYYGRAEPRDAVDLYFLMQKESIQPMMELALQKDPGFDRYWFAVALNRVAEFPDEANRWPVKMLVPFNPVDVKQVFQKLALDLMSNINPP